MYPGSSVVGPAQKYCYGVMTSFCFIYSPPKVTYIQIHHFQEVGYESDDTMCHDSDCEGVIDDKSDEDSNLARLG